ncbi:MAG: aromatic ring-hydroxylating dioxygenase subunit alpha [Gammaproteobacteria bacterium]|nr:aromatic ring-hydroxylating dioxygenase subunit alpha [Gammaproteobacteria bacterium]
MFERFPNRWTPVLPLTELTTNPLATDIAGEPVVLFADAEQQWHALIDRCPHRGAALSLGKVNEEGHLRCQYHGWRFDGAGRCTGVPLNELNAAALNKIRAGALPTREIGGALWVYTALTDDPPEPLLPESLEGDPRLFVTYHQEWDANWTRAQENFIDFAHPPYLHEQTIGAWMHDYAEQGGTARVETDATDFGMIMRSYVGSGGGAFQLDWYRPNLSILHFGPTPYNWLNVFCIPVNENHTRVMTVRRISSAADGPSYSRHASGTDHRILDEDRGIVESQAGDVLSDPMEISVATDKPTLVFRRWYRELLEQ